MGQGLRSEGSATVEAGLLARPSYQRALLWTELCSSTQGSDVEALTPVVTVIEIGPL